MIAPLTPGTTVARVVHELWSGERAVIVDYEPGLDADELTTARQVLLLRDRPRPGDRRPIADAPAWEGIWGDIPLEVLLAGGAV